MRDMKPAITDTVLSFVSLLRSGDEVSTKADRILRTYRQRNADVPKAVTSNDEARQLRLRAEAATSREDIRGPAAEAGRTWPSEGLREAGH